MKISIIGPTHPYRGGISHYTTLLCRELRKIHEVQFISFRRQYPKLIFPGKTDKDPSQTPLKVDQVIYSLDSIDPLSWISTAINISKFQPKLLIMPWWVAFWAPQFASIGFLVKKKCKANVLFICHNAIEHETSRWKISATRFVLRLGDRILTHSDQDSRRLKEILGSKDKVTTAFHPSYADLCGEIPECAIAKKRLFLHGKTILFFGFVREYKGLDLLLHAMPEVLKNENVTLLVVGEFWNDKSKYLRLIEHLKIGESVRIHDAYVPNEEMGNYFAAADLVVQPYRSASGSGICQLAYGFGKPVVATDLGSLKEVVRDGVNGRLVPPNDSDALAEAICDSLQPATLSTMTQHAAITAKRFSWKYLAEIICNENRS